MPIMKLTKRAIDDIKPTGRRFIVYDTELKGFGLKVTPAGSKTWCVEYRAGARDRSVSKRRLVLGATTTLTPDEARNAARSILARVALGEDPAAVKARAREIPSFREFAERYLVEEAEAKLKPKSVVNYRIYLRKHTYPALGSMKLDKVNPADVAELHRRIGQTKPMTANRVVECIGSVYRYAANCGLTERGHKSRCRRAGCAR